MNSTADARSRDPGQAEPVAAPATCPGCGGPVAPSARRREKLTCSPACRARASRGRRTEQLVKQLEEVEVALALAHEAVEAVRIAIVASGAGR